MRYTAPTAMPTHGALPKLEYHSGMMDTLCDPLRVGSYPDLAIAAVFAACLLVWW